MSTEKTTSTDAGETGTRDAIAAGALAGLLGGVVMALAMMIRADAIGTGFWLPMRSIAATWYGVDALIAGAGAVAIGIATHLAVSAGWGALFGFASGEERSTGVSFLIGVAYALGIWGVMTYLALPWFNGTFEARLALQPFWFWFGLHLLFGGTLGILTPAFAYSLIHDKEWVARERTADRSEGTPAGPNA